MKVGQWRQEPTEAVLAAGIKPGQLVRKEKNMKPNWRVIIEEAVDRGLEVGWNHAHKYTDTPTEHLIQEEQAQAIMECLGKYVIWNSADE